jgi:hypothetical protein
MKAKEFGTGYTSYQQRRLAAVFNPTAPSAAEPAVTPQQHNTAIQRTPHAAP